MTASVWLLLDNLISGWKWDCNIPEILSAVAREKGWVADDKITDAGRIAHRTERGF